MVVCSRSLRNGRFLKGKKTFGSLRKALLYVTLLNLCSCSSLPWSKNDESDPIKDQNIADNELSKERGIKSFRHQEKLPHVEQRQYQRMSRERLERENELFASAGSMWVMEGQRGYLFAENKSRNEGDPLSVKLEGAVLKQVEMKVAVIKKLLEEIESENRKFLEEGSRERGLAASASGSSTSASDNKKAESSGEDSQLSLDFVPTKVVEKMNDGNYRVRGYQTFMLGSRQFKVVLTGIVRPDDFSDEGISSNKLIEPEVDVLSVRKNKNEVR